MAEYKVPLDRGIQELKGGRSLAPGETVKLNAEQVKENKQLIDDGNLLEIKKGGDK